MDGVLVLNKPAGMTSFDVIARLRKRYGQKKFGHTGTLDPQASGVLVVLAGSAVKALQFLHDTDKEYIAELALGAEYDTEDVFGEKIKEAPVNRDFDFDDVLQSFVGPQKQKVPAVSAKKVNGKKLLDYKRQGLEVPEVWQDCEIYEIEDLDDQDLKFRVLCSSGTYIRSICTEIGEKTGNLAAMKSLVRTKACGFTIDQAQDLDAEEHTLLPITSVLDMETIEWPVPKDIEAGKHLHMPEVKSDEVLVLDHDQALAVYRRDHGDVYRCVRGLK